jgi:hypothetical protein
MQSLYWRKFAQRRALPAFPPHKCHIGGASRASRRTDVAFQRHALVFPPFTAATILLLYQQRCRRIRRTESYCTQTRRFVPLFPPEIAQKRLLRRKRGTIVPRVPSAAKTAEPTAMPVQQIREQYRAGNMDKRNKNERTANRLFAFPTTWRFNHPLVRQSIWVA